MQTKEAQDKKEKGEKKPKQPNPVAVLLSLGDKSKGKFIQSVVLAVFGVFFGILPYYFASIILISLIEGNMDAGHYTTLTGLILLAFLLKAFFANLSTSISHTAAFETMETIREKLMAKLERMPLGDVIATPSGEWKETIVDRVEGLETTLAHIIPEMVANLCIPLGLLVYLFILDWRMALATLAVVPLGMIFISTMGKTYPAKFQESVRINRHMNDTVVEYVNGIEVIKAFNAGSGSYQKFDDAVTANASFFYNWMKSCQWPMSCYTSICPSTLLTVLPLGCIFYANGSLSAQDFITVIILSMSIIGPILNATNYLDSVAAMSTVTGILTGILNTPELIRPEVSDTISGNDIEFKDVHFSYEEGKEVLKGINLTIPPDTVTAIVGPSGSGKSTLCKLLAGFWDVTEGSISIGGCSLKNMSGKDLSDRVAYVSQDNYLFDDTIRNNIRMGNRKATDTEVEEAAKKCGLHEFILGLPEGYDTKVGSAGGQLSGGERQRITIARAMLKNAPIVIFDEATAFTDPENEAVIESAVSRLIHGKTLIVIAHRLSTVTDSDRILLMNDGQVEAAGTHEELLQTSKLYESMWNAHMGAKDGE